MESLIYLYGMVPTDQVEGGFEKDWTGIDSLPLYTIRYKAITALVCDVNEEEFSEDTLEQNMNNLIWLKDKAIHHHETLIRLHESYTLIPLKLCTLFQEPINLEMKLEAQYDKIISLLNRLTHKEEWNLKIYCRDEELVDYVTHKHPHLKARQEEIGQLSPGKQFFARKQWEKDIHASLQIEKERRCGEVHKQLGEFSDQSAIKKNWRPDTAQQRKMSWNAVYSIDKAKSQAFIAELTRISQDDKARGFSFEPVGPWPNYYFANL